MTVRTSDVITAYWSSVGTDMMVARPSPAHHLNHAQRCAACACAFCQLLSSSFDRQPVSRQAGRRVDKFTFFISFLSCSTWSTVRNLNHVLYCAYVHDITHLRRHYWYEHGNGDGDGDGDEHGDRGRLSYGPYVFLCFSDVIVGPHEAGDVIVKTFRDRI